MDSSIDPCDDFHKFACGNYYKEKVLGDTLAIDHFISTRDSIKEKLAANIENDEFTEKDPKVFKQMQYYFKTCMDKSKKISFYINVNKTGT